jgi:hypothetical protein
MKCTYLKLEKINGWLSGLGVGRENLTYDAGLTLVEGKEEGKKIG